MPSQDDVEQWFIHVFAVLLILLYIWILTRNVDNPFCLPPNEETDEESTHVSHSLSLSTVTQPLL